MTLRSFLRGACLLALWMFVAARCFADPLVVNGDPDVRSDGVVRFFVQGEFRKTPALARDSALQSAQERMREWLGKQEPPIRRAPSLETIRREMIRQESAPQEEQILNQTDKQYRITVLVELQPKHVRALRERDRVITGLWTLGGLLAMLGVCALLFRVDEWTKGYLTRWLIAAGIGMLILIAAVWWTVR